MKYNIKYLSLLFLLIESILSEDSLKFTFSLIRHTARAPQLDTNHKDSLGFQWKQNSEELTSVGLRQGYILGLRYNFTYQDLIDIEHNEVRPGDMYVKVSYTNRTIQSYLAFIQGFSITGPSLKDKVKQERALPPGPLSEDVKKFITNDAAVGHFVSTYPYHIVEADDLYFFAHRNCDKFPVDIQSQEIKDNLLKLWNNRKNILSRYIQYDEADDIYTIRNQLLTFSDDFIANYYFANDLSNIVSDKQELKDFVSELKQFLASEYTLRHKENNAYLSRVGINQLIKALVSYIEFRVQNIEKPYDQNNPKMIMNFFHETNFGQFFAFFKTFFKDDLISNNEFSELPFGSFIDIQVKQKADKSFTVEIIYNDKPVLKNPIEVSVFLDKLKSNIIGDKEYNDFCFKTTLAKDEIPVNLLGLSIALAVVLIGLVVYIKVSSSKAKDVDRLNTENSVHEV